MDDECTISGLIVSRITIVRVLTDDDDIVDQVIAEDGEGDQLGLAESLGMLRLAEHTLLRASEDDEFDGDGE